VPLRASFAGMKPWILAIAAALGLSGVALGAFGAHGLKGVLNQAQLATFDTAVRYQLYHALVLVGVSLIPTGMAQRSWAARLLVAGVLLFSGSLYLYLAGGPRWLVYVTPAGGLCLMLGWLLLLLTALRLHRRPQA
jgi:uncharacterized membrane protein YgdD (TMEM256/DUF423 family)